ncbi:hypothetical protein BX600DRAFT_440088 [Xylariales sp. PMI_506]|nr:hypothetical protein BX600DRAFT_440088 [Xylariales sp. PMI_506]
MATSSCAPVTIDIQRDGFSTVVELPDYPGCGPSTSEVIHSLPTEALRISSSAVTRSASLNTTGSPQATTTSIGGYMNTSNSQPMPSSGLPLLTSNSSQTYRFSTASPSVLALASQSVRNNIDHAWTFILCMVLLPALLR